jgi:hypothetical protein
MIQSMACVVIHVARMFVMIHAGGMLIVVSVSRMILIVRMIPVAPENAAAGRE